MLAADMVKGKDGTTYYKHYVLTRSGTSRLSSASSSPSPPLHPPITNSLQSGMQNQHCCLIGACGSTASCVVSTLKSLLVGPYKILLAS